ncbi:hypothetical protein C0993_007677 [Termitomyces sp. T159_Od127]|nr:hypothetical protein C0993_007677 [Termitomyces sp. T159_Od127]
MLYDLFPLASIDPDLVSPLTASEFLQRILVPEIGARLIMQDMDLDESQMRDAVRILRESANYGVCMFPVDDGEEDEEVLDNAELGAADMIVMKRAMKRRQQLYEVDRAEEDEYQEQIKEKTKALEKEETVKTRARKKREKGLNDTVESSAQVSNTRHKPKPPGKSARTTSVTNVEIPLSMDNTDTEDMAESSQDPPKPRRLRSRSCIITHLASDKYTENTVQHFEGSRAKPQQFPSVTPHVAKTDVEKTPVSRPMLRRLPSRSTSTLIRMDTDETPRKAVVTTRSAVDVNLISSRESSADNDWDTGRMKHGQNQKKRRGRSKNIKMDNDEDDVVCIVPPSSSSRTRSCERTLSDSNDDTPKARGEYKTSANESDNYWDIPPLQRARERKMST